MKRTPLFFCAVFLSLLLTASKTDAQPDYWEKANSKYLRDYRERQRSTPNTPYRAPKVNTQSIEATVAQWKTPVSTPTETAEQKAQNEKTRKYWADMEISRQKWAKVFDTKSVPFNQLFLDAGFTSDITERRDVMSLLVWTATEKRKRGLVYLSKVITAKKTFEAEKSSSSLNALLPLVATYASTWETALADLDFLEKRFPAQIAAIDTARFFCHAYYLGLEFPYVKEDKYDNMVNFSYTDYKQAEMLEKFLQLYEKYPDMGLRIAASAYNLRNPFFTKFLQLETKDYENKKKYAWLILYTLPPAEVNPTITEVTNFSIIAQQLDHAVKNGGDKFFLSITLDEWAKIAAYNGGSAMNVMRKIFFGRKQLFVMPSTKNKSVQTDYGYWINQKNYYVTFELLEKLAATGDAEALNSLAVVTAMGLTNGKKMDCLWMLEEGAKNGSVWAALNLVWSAGWDLKKYTNEDKAKGIQGFKAFVATADSAQLSDAVYYVHNIEWIRNRNFQGVDDWPWINAFTDDLKKILYWQAALLGDPKAKELIRKYF